MLQTEVVLAATAETGRATWEFPCDSFNRDQLSKWVGDYYRLYGLSRGKWMAWRTQLNGIIEGNKTDYDLKIVVGNQYAITGQVLAIQGRVHAYFRDCTFSVVPFLLSDRSIKFYFQCDPSEAPTKISVRLTLQVRKLPEDTLVIPTPAHTAKIS